MMIDSYHFDKTPEDAQRETPVEDFSDALYAAADAVASTILGWRVGYATVCPGWSDSYGLGADRATLQYEPRRYTSMVSHDEPDDEDSDEGVRERMVRDATIRMACWVALGEDPSEAPYPVSHYVVDACERRYCEAGGFGPEPEIGWPEDEDSPEYEQAGAAHMDWYEERSEMFWDLVVYKATDVVANYYEAIVRVAVALCYQGILSGSQVGEIVEKVDRAERSAA